MAQPLNARSAAGKLGRMRGRHVVLAGGSAAAVGAAVVAVLLARPTNRRPPPFQPLPPQPGPRPTRAPAKPRAEEPIEPPRDEAVEEPAPRKLFRYADSVASASGSGLTAVYAASLDVTTGSLSLNRR
jgi:hypothetical protein